METESSSSPLTFHNLFPLDSLYAQSKMLLPHSAAETLSGTNSQSENKSLSNTLTVFSSGRVSDDCLAPFCVITSDIRPLVKVHDSGANTLPGLQPQNAHTLQPRNEGFPFAWNLTPFTDRRMKESEPESCLSSDNFSALLRESNDDVSYQRSSYAGRLMASKAGNQDVLQSPTDDYSRRERRREQNRRAAQRCRYNRRLREVTLNRETDKEMATMQQLEAEVRCLLKQKRQLEKALIQHGVDARTGSHAESQTHLSPAGCKLQTTTSTPSWNEGAGGYVVAQSGLALGGLADLFEETVDWDHNSFS